MIPRPQPGPDIRREQGPRDFRTFYNLEQFLPRTDDPVPPTPKF